MDNFDERFKDFDQNFRSTQKAVVGIGAVSALISLGIFVAIVAVAWHFISKLW